MRPLEPLRVGERVECSCHVANTCTQNCSSTTHSQRNHLHAHLHVTTPTWVHYQYFLVPARSYTRARNTCTDLVQVLHSPLQAALALVFAFLLVLVLVLALVLLSGLLLVEVCCAVSLDS